MSEEGDCRVVWCREIKALSGKALVSDPYDPVLLEKAIDHLSRKSTPEQEKRFRAWKSRHGPHNNGQYK